MVKCRLCNDSGFIPFINKQGKVIPNVKLFCECREEHPYSPTLRPEDIDFPISYSVYRSLCQEHGWPDPGADRPQGTPPQTQVVEHIHRTSRMSSQEFKELERINGTLKYLLSKEKLVKGKRKYERYE